MAATIVGPLRNIQPALPGGNSAAYNVSATGNVINRPCVLKRIVCNVAGSLTMNDTASGGTPGITNQIWTGALTLGQVVELDWPCGFGITVSALTSAVVSLSLD